MKSGITSSKDESAEKSALKASLCLHYPRNQFSRIISPLREKKKASESLMERIFTSDLSDHFYFESYERCGSFGANLRAHADSFQCDVDGL